LERAVLFSCVKDVVEVAVTPPLASLVEEEQSSEEMEPVEKAEDVVFESRVIIHQALHLPILQDSQ